MKKKTALLIVFFFAGLFLYGTESEYVIRSVSFEIEGHTREIVLQHYLDIHEGINFKNAGDLQTFISEKQQLIDNQRTIACGKIDSFYEPDPDNTGKIFVDLVVYVKDTWNYIMLPYAKFDSNDGFLLSLRGRNYNFLGGMQTLALNLDYLKPLSGGSEYSVNGRFGLPFYFWDYNWNFYFDEDVTVSPDDPLLVYTRAGLSVDIPFEGLTWEASANQFFYLNEDGTDDADGYYMKTDARIGSSIPIGVNIPGFGDVSYSPGVITSYAYKPFGTLSEERKGYALGVEHSLSAGRIDWKENFRDGMSFSLDQNLRYNFTRELWLSNSAFEFQYHKALGWGGFSSRLKGFYLYNDTDDNLGEPVRGILNNRLEGNAAVYLNMDFPVRLWIWFFDRWFEGHISPFLDYALVKPEGGSFSMDEGWYSGGLEGFVFFKKARSIYLRASAGVDLQAVLQAASLGDPAPRDGRQIYEIFIGLGHHY